MPMLDFSVREVIRRALLSWPLALIAGVAYALGSLHYAVDDRINVLVVWLLWAGLPMLGVVLSVGAMLWQRQRPWLFRLVHRPDAANSPGPFQRAQMLLVLQVMWLLFGLGLLLGFAGQLLVTDLAFGWRSTLSLHEPALAGLLRGLSWPWQAWWPSAVPDMSLLLDTRFQRIDPDATPSARAGDWWPFLMASLLFYHILPRLGLTAWCFLRWQKARPAELVVSAPTVEDAPHADNAPLTSARLADWSDARRLAWEWQDHQAEYCLGNDDWHAEDEMMRAVLAGSVERLYWTVPGQRSPVAELSDRIQQAREAGVPAQGLLVTSASGELSERHLASWQAFARQQGLSWLQDE